MRTGSGWAAGGLIAAVLLAGCSSAQSPAGPPSNAHPSIDAPATGATAVRRLDPAAFEVPAADRVLINVHIPDEGALPGTDLTVPYDEIRARVAELPVDRATPLAIYCMTDHMSGIAGQDLLALGYTDIVELDGGMQAWRASGRELLPAG